MGKSILTQIRDGVLEEAGRRLQMKREVLFFTEIGYTAYPQEEARELGYNNLMFPNEFFSPERAQEQ